MVGSQTFRIKGTGDERLLLTNKHDIVLRKTRFTCPRTASIGCDKASSDVPRNIVKELQNDKSSGILRITVE